MDNVRVSEKNPGYAYVNPKKKHLAIKPPLPARPPHRRVKLDPYSKGVLAVCKDYGNCLFIAHIIRCKCIRFHFSLICYFVYSRHVGLNYVQKENKSIMNQGQKNNNWTTSRKQPINANNITRREMKKSFERPVHTPSIQVPSNEKQTKTSFSRTKNTQDIFSFSAVTGDLVYNNNNDISGKESEEALEDFSFDYFINGTAEEAAKNSGNDNSDGRQSVLSGSSIHTFVRCNLNSYTVNIL